MSHSSKIFDEAPIKVQNRNGFDLSHLNCGTAYCGTLTPVLCKLLPPNSDFSLGVNMEVNLPPLATTFYGRIDAIIEGFVVPCSILYGGWKQFISNNPVTGVPSDQTGISFGIPIIKISDEDDSWAELSPKFAKNNSLFEYLGVRPTVYSGSANNPVTLNALPFLAYHLIWDTFYRNKQVSKTIFGVNPMPDHVHESIVGYSLAQYAWHSFLDGDDAVNMSLYLSGNWNFADGSHIDDMRQRNYARDYFTCAVSSPQQGNASKLKFNVTTTIGEFTISALRAANSLQKFLETNNLSQDYADMMRNRWGTRPIDADFDEPYYLGRVIVPVYQKSVYQQDSTGKSSAVNPFAKEGAIGAKGASAGFNGEGSITKKYHNTTWSYVMCLFSLVPHAAYAYGMNRELSMVSIGDFPAPEFQSIGYENIDLSELYFDPAHTVPGMGDFGYIPRYSRFKYMDDEVHGELRPGKTLDSFVLQRDFASAPSLGTSFLEIPKNALDSVFSVSTENMNLSCWYEIFFEFKVVMPLADFCIPTLGDIEDTHTIKTSVGGSRL